MPKLLPGLTVVLFSFTSPAFAGPVSVAKLQGFQGAKAALVAKIDAFLEDAKACNPPKAVLDKIVNGFANPDPKSQSAKTMLGVLEQGVVDHANAAEAKLGSLEKSASSCGDKAALLKQAADAGAEAQASLAGDAKDLKTGIDAAASNKTLLNSVFLAQQTTLLLKEPERASRCGVARAKIQEMEDANGSVAKSLADLQSSFSERVSVVTAAINAPASCQKSLVRPASYHEDETPFRETSEGDGTTAI